MPIVPSVATDAKQVALTFDDGPHPRYTDLILDTLAAESARATFFIRGGALNHETTALVERTAAEGHDVGNHTHHHLHLDGCPDANVEEEVRRTHFQLEEILGRPPGLIRPPYGEALDRVDTVAASLGYRATIHWSIQPNDWEMPPADTITRRILDELAPGAIVLLHDGCAPEQADDSRQGTVEALQQLIPNIRERGYELVTVSRLLDG